VTIFDLTLGHLQANLKSKHVAPLDRLYCLIKTLVWQWYWLYSLMSPAPNGKSRVTGNIYCHCNTQFASHKRCGCNASNV